MLPQEFKIQVGKLIAPYECNNGTGSQKRCKGNPVFATFDLEPQQDNRYDRSDEKT
jgi:hypothetical protein